MNNIAEYILTVAGATPTILAVIGILAAMLLTFVFVCKIKRVKDFLMADKFFGF